jgi:hypothetical protein
MQREALTFKLDTASDVALGFIVCLFVCLLLQNTAISISFANTQSWRITYRMIKPNKASNKIKHIPVK